MNNISIKWVSSAILSLPLLLFALISIVFLQQFFSVLDEIESNSKSRNFVMECYELESKVVESFSNLTLSIDSNGFIDPLTTRREFIAIEQSVNNLVTNSRSDGLLTARAEKLKNVYLESKAFIEWCLREQSKGSGNWKSANNKVPEKIISLCNEFIVSFQALIGSRAQTDNEQSTLKWHAIKTFLNSCLVASILLSLGLVYLFAISIKNPLSKIAARCDEIAANYQLTPANQSLDELGQLDRLIYALGVNLRQTLQNEKAMVQNARNLIFSIDVNGIIQRTNDFSQLLGYSRDEMIGKSFLDFCFQDDVSIADEEFGKIFKSEQSKNFEVRMQNKEGRLVETLWSCVLSEGELFVVLHDTGQAKNIQRLKDDFLNMISHDLRSPLSSLLVSFSMIIEGAKGPLPVEVRRELEGAVRNCERLIEFINDFLDLQKIESGNIQLELESVDLEQLVTETAEIMRGAVSAKNLTIMTFCETEPVKINADRSKLRRVILNLLSNAVTFSPIGSTISIFIERLPDSIELRVVDEGPGVPVEFRETIFEAFVQAPSSQSTKGTGLGLAICAQIVKAHGGQIGVNDTSGGGASFWVRLPAGQDVCFDSTI